MSTKFAGSVIALAAGRKGAARATRRPKSLSRGPLDSSHRQALLTGDHTLRSNASVTNGKKLTALGVLRNRACHNEWRARL